MTTSDESEKNKGWSTIYFNVQQKLRVPTRDGLPDIHRIDESFWTAGKAKKLGERKGCYVFAIEAAGRGGVRHLHPLYIGKTTRSFREECFASEKIRKLVDHLQQRRRRISSLYLILVAYPTRAGRTNSKAIDQLETFLIQMAKASPFSGKYLINDRKTQPHEWGIKGVIRGGRGRASHEARELAAMLELDGRN